MLKLVIIYQFPAKLCFLLTQPSVSLLEIISIIDSLCPIILSMIIGPDLGVSELFITYHSLRPLIIQLITIQTSLYTKNHIYRINNTLIL